VQRRANPTLHIAVPTCQATLAGTLPIAATPFIFGGAGDPPTPLIEQYPELAAEETITLPAFRIDRTEVTNAAYAVFAQLFPITGIAAQSYPSTHGYERAGLPEYPVTEVNWTEMRAYCRFLGKQLPTTQQWERVLRGGLTLPDGSPNPAPRRSFPWGTSTKPLEALFWRESDDRHVVPVASRPQDRSVEGAMDLGGNVNEWTDSIITEGPSWHIVRGGEWGDTSPDNALEYVGVINQRVFTGRYGSLGARCAINAP